MLIKSFTQNDVSIELYENVIFEGTSWEHVAYTIIAPGLNKSFLKLPDAMGMFEQLSVTEGCLCH